MRTFIGLMGLLQALSLYAQLPEGVVRRDVQQSGNLPEGVIVRRRANHFQTVLDCRNRNAAACAEIQKWDQEAQLPANLPPGVVVRTPDRQWILDCKAGVKEVCDLWDAWYEASMNRNQTGFIEAQTNYNRVRNSNNALETRMQERDQARLDRENARYYAAQGDAEKAKYYANRADETERSIARSAAQSVRDQSAHNEEVRREQANSARDYASPAPPFSSAPTAGPGATRPIYGSGVNAKGKVVIDEGDRDTITGFFRFLGLARGDRADKALKLLGEPNKVARQPETTTYIWDHADGRLCITTNLNGTIQSFAVYGVAIVRWLRSVLKGGSYGLEFIGQPAAEVLHRLGKPNLDVAGLQYKYQFEEIRVYFNCSKQGEQGREICTSMFVNWY